MSEIPTITVTGHGSVSVPPDKAVISFEVAFDSRDYEQAVSEVNTHIKRLREGLREAGIDPDQLKTLQFAVAARHTTRKVGEEHKQVFVGWNACQRLRLELGVEGKLLVRALAAIARCGGESSLGLSFEVSDRQGLQARVLAEATRAACLNARTIAEASGCKLGRPLKIKYGWSQMSFQSPAMYDRQALMICDSAPDVQPSDVEASDSVTILFALE